MAEWLLRFREPCCTSTQKSQSGCAHEAPPSIDLTTQNNSVKEIAHSFLLTTSKFCFFIGLVCTVQQLSVFAAIRSICRKSALHIGYTTKQLLETIVGSWIFVLMFRRPLLSLLSDVFHEGIKLPRREIFKLSTGSKQELLLPCICAPFAYTNLRASPLSKVFCTDASTAGGGICYANVSRSCTLELCRVAEQRGFYRRIDNSTLGAFMAMCGEEIAGSDSIPKGLSEGFLWDFCEVFRGTGHLSNAHRELGLTVHPGFDLLDGACGDVLLPSTFSAIVGLICRRVVKAWHIAPAVCTTCGTLRRPRLRSKLIPFGFEPDEPHTALGNQFAMRGGFIPCLCILYGLCASSEQPGGSVMHRLEIFQRVMAMGFFSMRFPFCNWGTPFEKMSWWLSNNPRLQQLAADRRMPLRPQRPPLSSARSF